MALDPITVSVASACIAVSALTVSVAQYVSTHVYRGRAFITQPTVIYFGPDGGGARVPKVYLRAMLYTSASRGRALEHLYVRVSRRDAAHTFSRWVYGEKDLHSGGGLFVPPTGVVTNHHFMTGEGAFRFTAGDYTLEVMGRFAGDANPVRLLSTALRLGEADAKHISDGGGILFDWSSEAGTYVSRPGDGPPPRPMITDQAAWAEALGGLVALGTSAAPTTPPPSVRTGQSAADVIARQLARKAAEATSSKK